MGNGEILKVTIPKFATPEKFDIKHTHASVILGAYPLAAKFESAIEMGCGNGVSSVIMALLNSDLLKMIAVDVDKQACENALTFVKLNNLSKRISVLNADVLEVPKIVGYESVDFVFFNPPFHVVGKVSEDKRRFLERNEDVFERFVLSTFKVLKNKGYFRMITSPVNTLNNFDVLRKHNLTPKTLVPIYGKKGADSKLILIEGLKNGKERGFKVKAPVFLDEMILA